MTLSLFYFRVFPFNAGISSRSKSSDIPEYILILINSRAGSYNQKENLKHRIVRLWLMTSSTSYISVVSSWFLLFVIWKPEFSSSWMNFTLLRLFSAWDIKSHLYFLNLTHTTMKTKMKHPHWKNVVFSTRIRFSNFTSRHFFWGHVSCRLMNN